MRWSVHTTTYYYVLHTHHHRRLPLCRLSDSVQFSPGYARAPAPEASFCPGLRQALPAYGLPLPFQAVD